MMNKNIMVFALMLTIMVAIAHTRETSGQAGKPEDMANMGSEAAQKGASMGTDAAQKGASMAKEGANVGMGAANTAKDMGQQQASKQMPN